MRLTSRIVDALPIVAKATTFFDQELKGFGVRVTPPTARSPLGSRSWIVEYRPGGGGRRVAKRRVTLAAVSVLEAGEARSAAKVLLAKVRLGEDPAGQLSEVRRAASVRELSEQYCREVVALRKPKTQVLYETYWRLHILPDLGAMKARDITRSDVARLHRKIGAKYPVTANRVATVLGRFFRWASSVGAVPEGFNPATRIERYRETMRERYLSHDELQRLGAAIREAETVGIPWNEKPGKVRSKHEPKRPENRRTRITPHAAAAIRLLLFTGARLREILHLRWTEVDLQRGLLLLPDSKTGRRTIILGSPALQVLADLDKLGEYVIAGEPPKQGPAAKRPKDKPRSDLNRPWALVSRRAGLAGVRLHDLRHTFASYGATGGLGLPVIGGLLGHANPKTTARYAHIGADPLRRASDVISNEISAAMLGAKKPDAVDA